VLASGCEQIGEIGLCVVKVEAILKTQHVVPGIWRMINK
jgi:hypothetical protein